MKIVGLTGGIGSGKSTVAALFKDKGVPVYYADDRAKFLMSSSPELIGQIKQTFGESAYSNGILNRTYLAEIVFDNEKRLHQLNSIVHPAVQSDFQEWLRQQNNAYIIQENPLIFEKQLQRQYDQIILVTAPLEERIQRVMSRDGASRQAVLNRIKHQLSDREKRAGAHFVIDNLDKRDTIIQVEEIHRVLMA